MASPMNLALAPPPWGPPPRPYTSISFQVFDPSLPPLSDSPSPFIPAAWEALLQHYPGDLGRVCSAILADSCRIGCAAPPVYRHTRNNSMGRPLHHYQKTG